MLVKLLFQYNSTIIKQVSQNLDFLNQLMKYSKMTIVKGNQFKILILLLQLRNSLT